MTKKIIYKKQHLLGSKSYDSIAMKDILKKDKKYDVINQDKEKKQLFYELKKYRDGGVTERELKGVLADLKYRHSNFSKKEINLLAQELKLGDIKKKHIQSKTIRHASRIDRASHSANFYDNKNRKHNLAELDRQLQGDGIVNFESNKFVRDFLKTHSKKMIVDGENMFNREEKDIEFFDTKSGKRFFGKTTKLTRPNLNTKSQSSLQGRGIIAGLKK